jgi:hypothetical protein
MRRFRACGFGRSVVEHWRLHRSLLTANGGDGPLCRLTVSAERGPAIVLRAKHEVGWLVAVSFGLRSFT